MKISDTSNVTAGVSSTTSQVQQVGKFQAREVTAISNSVLGAHVDGNIRSVPNPTLVRTRSIELNTTPMLGVNQQLVNELGLGEVTHLANYLANNVEEGNISRDLLSDFETAVTYARQVDEDITQASVLLEKSNNTPLSEAEQAEVQSLMGANKHNLSLIQGWMAEKQSQLSERGQLSGATDILIQSLQQRFADRHMDVADLISLYDLDEMPAESVSRSDRIDANLLQATAALTAARRLSVRGLSEPAKTAMVKILEDHQNILSQAKAMADNHGRVTQLPPDGELTLAAKEIWDTPFTMISGKKAQADSLEQLQAHWDNKAPGNGSESWLPLAHPKVGQSRMLQEFMQHQLTAAGIAKKDMPDLKFMIAEGHNQALNNLSWEPIVKTIHYQLGQANQPSGVAESTITPAKAMAKNFAEDYPSNGVNCSDRLQYKHVPNLAHTQLTDENGKVLFMGLRHGVLDPYDLTPKVLKKLPDVTLKTMISDLLIRDGVITAPDGGNRDDTIADILNLIRTDPKSATEYSSLMRTEASKDMAKEMAVAALVSDKGKFQNALDGKTVTIDMSSISLLTPDLLRTFSKEQSNERAMLQRQTAALVGLAQSKPVELTVRDAQGTPQTIKANINVRTFNFGVNGGAIGTLMHIPSKTPVWRNLMGWGFAMDVNNPELDDLVGPAGSKDLGGRVYEKLNQMDSQRQQLQKDLQIAGGEGRDTQPIQDKINGVAKDIRKLSDAARQLKMIWHEGSFISGDREPYKMVSRLALVSHLVGETPLFNCKSGKDRTGQLDAEVKYLAAYAEKKGSLPSPEAEVPGARQMRSQFTLGSGNLEMQRLNTGLPGYKLKWSELPGLANMVAEDAMEPLYRGGSDHISA